MNHDPDGQLALGEVAPDFELPGVDGRSYRLRDASYPAKAYAVIFWCNHCPYVIKNEERVIALGREFMPRDVAFYLISVNDTTKYPMDDFPSMQRRSREKSYPFPYLFDESQVSAVQFGAKTTPHVFLFDAGYRLVYRGAVDDNTDYFADVRHHYLRDALASLLAGKPDSITTPATQPIGCSIKWK